MKVTELREMTLDELKAREAQLAEEVARMRLQLSLKRLDDPLKIRYAKRELARVKTLLTERQRVNATPGAPAPTKPAAAKSKKAQQPEQA